MAGEKVPLAPTRDGFGKALVELGRADARIVVLSADLTDSTRAAWFKKEFPERFFSFGVAEQDMVSAAAGFSLMGKIPFVCTFGVFASGRAWDQIRVSIAYMQSNVKIVGTHGGVSVGGDGATHQALEEITLMRVLPNMTIVVPADAFEAKKATIAAAQKKGPVYLRLGRNAVPAVTEEKSVFTIGKADTLVEGSDVTIFSCGQLVYESILACEMLKAEKISARVVNMHTPKPLDIEAVRAAARETQCIVTAEEHSVFGGMGSAVAEVIAEECPVPLKRIGVRDQFGASGEPDELLAHFKLDAKSIAQAAREAIRMKGKR